MDRPISNRGVAGVGWTWRLMRRDCRRLDGLRTEPVEVCREGASDVGL